LQLLSPISHVPQDRQYHPGCDQLHSISLLLRCAAVSPGNLLSTFRNKLAHTSSWREIFLILSNLEYEINKMSRKVDYRLPSDTAS
jgi:hypothetical protein